MGEKYFPISKLFTYPTSGQINKAQNSQKTFSHLIDSVFGDESFVKNCLYTFQTCRNATFCNIGKKPERNGA